MTNSLDLYAKIEPLIGFYDEYEKLYSSYLQLLLPLHVKSVLDIGCGNGKLLRLLENNGYDALGIERSQEMVKIAQKLGVKAELKEMLSLHVDSFDCALAVGDVLNYIKDDELDDFFQNVTRVVKKGGYFLADINTLNGFEVADGVMVQDFKNQFLSVEASFADEVLETNMTLFEKKETRYKKYSGKVLQYFHEEQRFQNLEKMRLISSSPISMFSDEEEKLLMLFQVI